MTNHYELHPYPEESQNEDYQLYLALLQIFKELDYFGTTKQVIAAPNYLTALILERVPSLKKQFENRTSSVLWITILYGYVKSAELLVQNGADVNEQLGHIPGHIVGHHLGDEKATVLHLVFTMQDPTVWSDQFVDTVIRKGADFRAQDSKGQTSLHIVAMYCRVGAAELLLEKGADVNAIDNSGRTPLLCAATATSTLKIEMAKLFLKHGADANAQMENGIFLLYIAVRDLEMLRVVIQSGAKINMRTDSGRTALHEACSCDPDTVRAQNVDLLLRAGANILAEDHNGNTPLALLSFMFISLQKTTHLLKELALKKVCLHPSIELKDKKIISQDPYFWEFYNRCIEYLNKMKLTRIIERCTFFDLLTKSHCQIAPLMNNSEFKISFRNYDMKSAFHWYSEDLCLAFKLAECYYWSMAKQEDVINQAFYEMLPQTAVRKLARYLCAIIQKKYIVKALSKKYPY